MTVDRYAMTGPNPSLSIAKGAAIGASLGFVVFAGLILAICAAVGMPGGSAAGIAVFAALWGGPGFGAMLGAVWAAHAPEDR